MKWLVHVAHMGELRKMHTKILSKSQKGRDHLYDPEINGRVILK
jgi:hypothetical protein